MTIPRVLLSLLCLLGIAAISAEPVPAPALHETRVVEGWTVHVRTVLLAEQKDATEKALALLQAQLREIVRVVPVAAVGELRKIPLWISPEYAGVRPRAEYHPDRRWLAANGRDAAMAKGVEFTNVRIFAEETDRMPCFALHELAHGYHDRVLGFDHAEIKAAYDRAKTAGSYEKVERWFGKGRPNTHERAYAMTTAREYFAETTEAFFGRNDFFPFVREELEKHDAPMAALLQRLWNPAP